MTLMAKIAEPHAGRRYLVEESIAASLALVASPVLCAITAPGPAGVELRYGFTTIFTTATAAPALLIGVLYGILAIFGTMVYLNPRENTFAVPVNRGASLLSGFVASWISVRLFGSQPPAASQLVAASVIVLAILFLGVPSTLEFRRRRAAGFQLPDRLFVFVCAGNTSRSPMAQAICNAEVARRLSGLADSRQRIHAVSAGIQVQPGSTATPLARSTIGQLGLPSIEHTATTLTRDMIRKAEFVFCMTASQRISVIQAFPEAAWKTFRLDPAADIEDPAKQGPEVYARVAAQLKICIDRHLDSIGLPRRVQAASASA
jgi:protein-tyrosine-phosphatase